MICGWWDSRGCKRMKIVRKGIILNTERYVACVAFYREVLGLRYLFEKSENGFSLTCLEFGDSYLMIETEGKAVPEGKSIEQSPAKLRFHVDDIAEAKDYLMAKGIEAEIEEYEWGSTINLFDPDGNRIGIRDESGFARDLKIN